MRITYTTENPTSKYAWAIRRAKNKDELLEVLNCYKEVADDAIKVAETMTKKDFKQFKIDIKKAKTDQGEEWNNKFNERFGIIAMPKKLMISTLIADRSVAPWGCAFIRCQELGYFNSNPPLT